MKPTVLPLIPRTPNRQGQPFSSDLRRPTPTSNSFTCSKAARAKEKFNFMPAETGLLVRYLSPWRTALGAAEEPKRRILVIEDDEELSEAIDPPPLNRSTLRYVFGHEKEGPQWRGSVTSLRRSSPIPDAEHR